MLNYSDRVSKETNYQFEANAENGGIWNDSDKSKSYSCQECKITFPLKRYFTDHFREKHVGFIHVIIVSIKHQQ
jgi:hypothetical protein